MLAADLEKGHNVELEVTNGTNSITLFTSIAGILADHALLNPIMQENRIIGFNEGLTINFFYANSETERVYAWNNVSIKLVKYESKPYHLVKLTGEASAVNRRSSFRVYIGEETDITSLTSQGPKKTRVLIKDISETGFAFVTNEEYELNRIVKLTIPFNNLDILMQGITIRKAESETVGQFIYGCKFAERNKLIPQYLMQVQQEKQKNKMHRPTGHTTVSNPTIKFNNYNN